MNELTEWEIEVVKDYLKEAEDSGMLLEVVITALISARDESQDPGHAMQLGCREWTK